MGIQDQLVPFDTFLAAIETASHTDFAEPAEGRAGSVDAFEAFRAYLMSRYSGVDVPHSFLDDTGQTIDCIPIDQQPARRARPDEALRPVPALPAEAHASAQLPDPTALAPSMMPVAPGQQRYDVHGNLRQCPAGTIPVVRITLSQLARFENLQEFFRKAPDGGRLPDGEDIAGTRAAEAHKYAHAAQSVANIGGASIVNIWQPLIASGQIFSLSQQWYVAGSGTSTQTVECGWQVYPNKYGTRAPVLFIYYTSANYADGSGCYNLDCDAFTQVSTAAVIGGAFNPVSQSGGQQLEAKLSFLFDGLAWWLIYQDQPIGYYSQSLFHGGGLSRGCERIDFGGEVVGTNSFPHMGSGAFPDQSFGFAAYQRNAIFYPPAGGIAETTLDPQQDSPACYRINLLNNSGTSWGTHFFFGGPGGINC